MLSFKIIGYLVFEKLFEGFYYEHGGNLGQVTRTIYTNTFVLPSYQGWDEYCPAGKFQWKMPENSGMANTPKITEVAYTGIYK